MMKYTKACMKAVEAYTDAMNAYGVKKDELERQRKAERIGKQEYERRLSELHGTDSRLYAELVQTISNARAAYMDSLPNRYRRSSETMNADDLALLSNPHAGLTADDVAAMFAGYAEADNLGMMGAIAEINAQRSDPASITYYDKKRREDDAQTFAEAMTNAARAGGLHAALAIKGNYIPASLVGE